MADIPETHESVIPIQGEMTLPHVHTWLAAGEVALSKGDALFDFSAVTQADSSGLAVIFSWQRAARAHGRRMRVVNLPASLNSLAEVYGVQTLLPLATPSAIAAS